MTDTAVMTLDPYKSDAKVRADVKGSVTPYGFDVESYGMVDKKTKDGPIRTLTIGLEEMLGDSRPQMLIDLCSVLDEWGYSPDSVKITIKASKPTSDQMTLPMGGDGDNEQS